LTLPLSATDRVVPLHHPRVLVEVAVALGADRDAVLEGTGVTADMLERAEERISYEQFGTLERNALRLSNEPGLGLRWGRAIHLSQSGLVGIATLGAATAEAAFQLARLYYQQVAPGWNMDLRVEEGRAYLALRETIDRGDLRPFATEAMLAGFFSLAEQVLGHSLDVAALRLAYPRPAHHELYGDYLGGTPLVWDQPVTEAAFDPAVLREPVATTRVGASVARGRVESAAALQPDGIAARVRKVLLAHGARRMGLEQVARELRTSARSLRRALSQAGTSYQDIAEELLRARAEEWIRTGSEKVEHIALELGFTDARSFRRAFKRWTGHNPNELRRSSDPT
jgi:AraC-like DNA-binding protein